MANYTSLTDNKSISFPGKFSLSKGETATIDRVVLSESPIQVKVFGTYDTTKAPKGGGGDALHSFQSRKSDDFGGRMNDAIILASLEIYEKGINPYVKSLKVEFSPNKTSGPKVIWEAIITESPDGKAYVGFSSRGGAGDIKSGTAVNRAEQQAKDKKKSLPKDVGDPALENLDVLDYRNTGAKIRQIFWQYTMPTKYPPKTKNANTPSTTTPEVPKEPVPVSATKIGYPINKKDVPKKYIKLQSDFNFDVKKENTFIITSGANGNLVALPDGRVVDLGELTLVQREDPNDPEIIKLLTPFSEEIADLDEEYRENAFEGIDDEMVFADPETGELDKEFLASLKGPEPSPSSEQYDDSKYPISKDIEANIQLIIQECRAAGITNGWTIAAIIAVCKKECALIPQNENSYAGTDASAIKGNFKGAKKYSLDEIDIIKKDPVKFFNMVYGGMFNNATDEGYKYRGRGLNQLTFKGNYELFGPKVGYDIVSDPELVNKIEVAAKVLAQYMKWNFENNATKEAKKQYNFTHINSFKSLDDATGAVYHANAGFKKPFSEIKADGFGGRAKTFSYVGPIYKKYLEKDKPKIA